MTTFATTSPREFPHARTVAPKIMDGTLKITPMAWRTPTRLSAARKIHTAEMIKPQTVKT